MRVLTDFHHSSLLRSLVLLFQDRLGMELYRPIGMEWYQEGYWAINNLEDTAKQYLDLGSQPVDNTPRLNQATNRLAEDIDGTYFIADPGGQTVHGACTLEYFKRVQFDYIIASIPAHVPIFQKLIAEYQPTAKLIVQMGNNWNIEQYRGLNVLASIAPQPAPGVNVCFYHQEFDLDVFAPSPALPTKKIYSFVNVIEHTGIGWEDYQQLKRLVDGMGYEVKAFGGQCPDGNTNGAHETAAKMREAQFIFHVKPGGDGFGHVIHNAYALGRPVITRPSHYRGQLAEQLLVPGTFIDLDRYGPGEVKNIITRLTHETDHLAQMGKRAAERFREVVNYQKEAHEVGAWLEQI